MRILWLSHLVPYPPKGGVLQRSYHLIHELSKYHDVDLLAFYQPNLLKPMFDSPEIGLKIAKRELGAFCNRVDVFNIDTTCTKHGNIFLALKSLVTKDPYNINWLKSVEFRSHLKLQVKNRQYDLVHFDTISLIPYFNEIRDTPSILDHHNIESSMLLHRAGKEKNWLKKWYFQQEGRRLEKYEKEFCPRFSLNITCSDIDSQKLKKLTRHSNVVTIPNGVDVEQFNPINNQRTCQGQKGIRLNRIVFIGRLNWYPNAEAVSFLAKEIWPLLKAKIPNIVCDIIGANPPKSVQMLAKEDSDFRVHGFVENIMPYMSQANIYVCPISNGGGTKLKVLDALAMGMPLVAHPFACEGIDVTDGKNVIFAKTGKEFVRQIISLLDSPVQSKALGNNGRELILEKYSYSSIGRLFADQCESIRKKI